MALGKNDLVDYIADDCGFTKMAAAHAIESFVDCVTKALSEGDSVSIIGFGKFEAVKREARTGRNPATGKEMSIPAKRVPKFTPGKNLKEAVDE